MKNYFSLLLLLLSLSASAQVHNGGFFLPSQQAVDSIGQMLSQQGITTLTGGLWIGRTSFGTRSDITDLSPLSSLTKLGSLIIEKNERLKNLLGLHNLDTIGGGSFFVRDNDSLIQLSSLQNAIFTSLDASLDSHVEIINNPQLNSLDGLEGVTKIGGQLRVQDNPALISLEGLKNLTFVGFLTSFHNFASPNLNGLEKFGGPTSLFIKENPFLVDITGLQYLDTITSLYLIDLSSLQNIDPLEDLVLYHLNSIGDRNTSYLTLLNCPEIQKIPNIHFGKNTAAGVEFLELDQLSDISGLHELEDFNTFHLRNCENLSHFEMPNLKAGGNFYIEDNDKLQNFTFPPFQDSLLRMYINDNLTLTELIENGQLPYVYDAEINNNPKLKFIQGFNALTGIGNNLEIRNNPQLEIINGFEKIKTIERSLYIQACPIDSISGFNQLISVDNNLIFDEITGDLVFPNFDSLQSIGGGLFFHENTNLKTIKGFPMLKHAELIDCATNENLASIEGFNLLDSLFGYLGSLYINNNPTLRSFQGFHSLKYVEQTIHCYDNPSLTDCSALCNIQASLDTPAEFNIYDNASPCDSETAVELYCDTLYTSVLQIDPIQLSVFPNPTTDKITLAFDPEWNFQFAELLNIQGQILLSKHIGQDRNNWQFDLGAFPDGMYFLRVYDTQNQSVQKRVILHRL